MVSSDLELMAHLMRRAGFGAGRDELEARVADGYQKTVELLLDPETPDEVPEDVLRRYYPDYSGMMGLAGSGAYWLYRMILTRAPLREKMSLFWHGVFATGYAKLTQGKILIDQVRMFRRHGMGSFRTLLLKLSRDPAMIIWLDNHDNHKDAINENYGREFLELFSMGVGNYTEQDIKECARAFTGWTVANTDYVEMKAARDSLWPYGRTALRFEYRPEDHDDGEKTFLGRTGRFNGEDIIDIICEQQATARFISRHLYSFFVADEPPVPQWPYQPPRDPEAIEILSQAYFESKYDIRAMLHTLFNSDFFRSEECWYEKVKSPAELITGVLRLGGEFDTVSPTIQARASQMVFMGQQLVNPPSVEGWHQGIEWVDTGTAVERINFASSELGDPGKPGVQDIIVRLLAATGGGLSPERLVQGCLDEMGALRVSDDTRAALVDFASQEGETSPTNGGGNGQAERRVAEMMAMIAASPDFQRA